MKPFLGLTGALPGALFFLAQTLQAASPAIAADPSRWSIEQMPGGRVQVNGDTMVIEDAGGCTVWYREKLTAPVEISYDVTVVAKGGKFDRVSDLNCFWMASDPKTPGVIPSGRSGKFSDYNSLFTYYVGYGGNNNSTTRFRRYDSTEARPLLPEHDLSAPEVLLRPNKVYHLRLVARDGVAEFWRDGERIFAWRDPSPLVSGWFGFRTVKSHLEIRNFQIRPAPAKD